MSEHEEWKAIKLAEFDKQIESFTNSTNLFIDAMLALPLADQEVCIATQEAAEIGLDKEEATGYVANCLKNKSIEMQCGGIPGSKLISDLADNLRNSI